MLRLLGEWAPRLLAQEGPPARPRSVPAAALRCALDCAQLGLEGQRRGLRIGAILGGGAVRELRVNAVIGDGPPEWVREQAAAAVAAGYGTLKLKVAAGSLDEDLSRVEAVREAAPDALLRLDANGGWDAATAAAALGSLARYDIEYVEQPLPSADLAGLARLRAEGVCRIGADESIADPADGERVPRRRGRRRAGAQADAPRRDPAPPSIAWNAAWEHIACVVTTTFDSSLGLAAALHLAAVSMRSPRGVGSRTGLVRRSTSPPTSSQSHLSRTRACCVCRRRSASASSRTRPPRGRRDGRLGRGGPLRAAHVDAFAATLKNGRAAR